MVGGKMRLAEERGVVSSGGKRSREAFLTDRWVQIDTIVVDAMGPAKLTCQNRGT